MRIDCSINEVREFIVLRWFRFIKERKLKNEEILKIEIEILCDCGSFLSKIKFRS